MVHKIDIDEFLTLARQHPVLDVRSPGEYSHAHIPGAYSLPLFTDEERKVVGTAYKQQDRQSAIKIGLDYFGVKMRKMVEEVEELVKNYKSKIPNPKSHITIGATGTNSQSPIPNSRNCILVHCWRGGMRSAGVAWLLDLYGFKVYTLVGGYKTFRNRVLQEFSTPFKFHVVGGYTGSGKTVVLQEMAKAGHLTIDLEGLANHKGSAFGALGQEKQPSQEMFENKVAVALIETNTLAGTELPIWIEDESRRIGDVNLPVSLWNTLRSSKLFFLDIPEEERLNYIVTEYGKFRKDELAAAVMRISKRLGGLATKQAINHLIEDNHKECFRLLLSYYDKHYKKGLFDRENAEQLITTISAENVNASVNRNNILASLDVLYR
jgi:tRNA 2-selenouridine synthase